MKNLIKVSVAALAFSVVHSAFAESVELEEERESTAEGYFTPVAIGLATPVQMPWGLNRWDVFGLDLNLFYTDVPKIYGLGIGGLATLEREKTIGCIVSGLGNISFDNVVGLRLTAGINYTANDVWGMEAGLVGFRRNFCGLDVDFLGAFQQEMCGAQFSGLANISKVESHGASIAGLVNFTETAYGLQLAGLFNYAQELHGAQVALVNYTEDCPSGFQIGLVNIILQNKIKFLPIVNGYF